MTWKYDEHFFFYAIFKAEDWKLKVKNWGEKKFNDWQSEHSKNVRF